MKHKQRMERLLLCLDKTLLVIASTMTESASGIAMGDRVRLQNRLAKVDSILSDIDEDIKEENKYHPPVYLGDEML